jgi:hypothetical protein
MHEVGFIYKTVHWRAVNKTKFTLQDIIKMHFEEEIGYCLAMEIGEDILLKSE